MPDRNEVCDFVWQYEKRKRWITYAVDDIQLINKAVQAKVTSVLLPGRNSRKQFIVDLEKMVQRNKVTLYEQRIRCLVTNSGCSVWLWKDNHENWNCYKPYLAFYLEIAFQRNDKIFRFHDKGDYEVNFETWLQTNEDTLNTNAIKRENVEFAIPTELKNLCDHSEILLKRICSNDIPSAKRIKIDLKDDNTDENGIISISANAFNPLNLNDSVNTELVEASPSRHRIVPVDQECPERENFHIYCEGEIIYSATLNQTNMQNNNNKYYIIQLLEHNKRKQFAVWRRWGRVGHKGQRDLSKFGSSLPEAKESFEQKFYDKTRNNWSDLKNFVHVKGKYDLLQMDLCHEQVKDIKTDVKSRLPSDIQKLMEIICDKKRMEDILKEMSYDSAQTPLGKLTLKQIIEGYIALRKVADILSAGGKGPLLVNACNDFYTKIPHSFGMKVPPVLRTQHDIDEKLKMLEALSNITIAMSVLNSTSNGIEHPLDKYYQSLDCSVEVLSRTSAEYEELEKCLKGTHGPTHTTYELEIIDAFSCYKPKEYASFQDSENKLLLWHGSRLTNWMGILKEGLRIAPPEAPVTGYMFGKGLYFADVSSKSANYCFATKKKNEGLLLMCEVSVGNQYPLTAADENLPLGLPSGFDSVIGKGSITPSAFKTGVLS
ncbi:Poly [ADP-ribose] polymerase 2 like protein [Argiope bruennichi]|uniref:Poly [ADP-ribose] polymerase n=1 Tax=Argiope bruennichi TaxID=94029 RepID=A0A8T0FLG0_ARGBR|nr:Poly [ADP-ribose] polymerase 2 like protein [Argiope bruennichi]